MKDTRSRSLALAIIVLMGWAAPGAAAQSAWQYTLPQGWTESTTGDTTLLVPGAEANGAAQVMLLAPKAQDADFNAQFDGERASLETQWGLRAAQGPPAQKGVTTGGPYAAYFASYDIDGDVRYLAFLALGRNGKFAMLVFVAASDTVFNQIAPKVTAFWQTVVVH